MSFKAHKKSSAMQTLMLHMLGRFAEFERDLIVSRPSEGKAYAKANNPNFKKVDLWNGNTFLDKNYKVCL